MTTQKSEQSIPETEPVCEPESIIAPNPAVSSQTPFLTENLSPYEVAATALAHGWSILPVDQYKHPLVQWRAYQQRLPEPDEYRTIKNISCWGVITGGLSGVIVLDCDDEQSHQFMQSLGLEPHVQTGSGGYHYYFQHPRDGKYKTLSEQDKVEVTRQFGKLDTRADGGYAIFYGTSHKGTYRQLKDFNDLYELSVLPENLLAYLRDGSPKPKISASRGMSLTSGTSTERLLGKAREKLEAGGGRDNTCFWLACQLRDNRHPEELALQVMKDFHALLPDTNTKGQHEPFSLEEAVGKVTRAYLEEPRAPWRESFALTDIGNGERFAAQSADLFRFDETQGWMMWDGARWKSNAEAEAIQHAKGVAKGILHEATALAEEARHLTDQEQEGEQKRLETLAKQTLSHAMNSQAAARLHAMLKMASTDPQLRIASDQWDRHPWWLNVLNGTLDLRSGELRPHNRTDLMTRMAPIKYDTQANCPNWLKFLNQVTGGDQDLQRYLKRVVGYTLTGSTQEHAIFVLYGLGQNGKSTFMDTIMDLLGDYAMMMEANSLLSKKSQSINNDIARLKGARLAAASEPDMGAKLDESLLKKLASGEKVAARFLHKEFFEFIPEFKLFLSTNHMPEVRGMDRGIWRRLKLLPFTVTIPNDQRMPNFREKCLLPELEGILAWAVEGATEWNQAGLAEPNVIKRATEEYRSEMDYIATFIDERCVTGERYKVWAHEIYPDFKTWCEQSTRFAIHKNKFGMELKARGFQPDKSNGRRFYRGIRLKTLEEHNREQASLHDSEVAEEDSSSDLPF